MRPDIVYRKAVRVLVAIMILAFIPAALHAQKKGSSSGGGSSKPAPAPAQHPAQKPATPGAKPGAPGAKPATPGARPGTPGARPATPGAKPATPGARPGAPGAKPATPAAKPAAQPAAVHNPNGTTTINRPNGSSVTRDAKGKTTSVTTPGGAKANYNSAGKVSSIHTSVTDKNPSHSGEMNISKGAHNQRTVVTTRKDGARLVSTGGHRGFVEHASVRNGRPYMRRTYVVNGHAAAFAYRGYPYRGGIYYGYVPGYYYGPGYYGWAYDPWGGPVPYAWGWGGDPWYGYYGGYFAAAPVYPGASLWLTDYVISQNLQAAYAAQADANGGVAPPPSSDDQSGNAGGGAATQNASGITPEVKQQISEEVKAQIAAEKDAAAQPAGAAQTATGGEEVPAALDPKHSVFIVSAPLQEQLEGGPTCTLSAGDILTRTSTTPDANQKVNALVTSSQKGDCQAGSLVAVAVQDLQDMHNDFAMKIDGGLKQLADSQGKNGIPSGPAGAGRANPDGAANVDLTAVADLQQQQQAADQTENDVMQAEGSGRGD
jgi:hypothetical protein